MLWSDDMISCCRISQVMARIDAFCSRKHQRINERKIRQFCGVASALPEALWDSHTSCARVDAVNFTRHNKSRIKSE